MRVYTDHEREIVDAIVLGPRLEYDYQDESWTLEYHHMIEKSSILGKGRNVIKQSVQKKQQHNVVNVQRCNIVVKHALTWTGSTTRDLIKNLNTHTHTQITFLFYSFLTLNMTLY